MPLDPFLGDNRDVGLLCLRRVSNRAVLACSLRIVKVS